MLRRRGAEKGLSARMSDTIIRSPRGRLGFATNVGRVRPVDEDSVLAVEIRTAYLSDVRTRLLLMVADGMGGHRRGDVASRIGVQTVARTMLPLLMSQGDISRATYHQELQAALVDANQAILAEGERSADLGGMGTTAALAVSDGLTLHLANVGDSRVYVINDREIFQVTRDHSLVQQMVDRGEITAEEAKHHPRKNVITMALGVSEDVAPDIGCMTVEPSDTILVCCDGLINHVEDDAIHRVVAETSDPQRACEILVALANKGGGTDNISVVIAPVPSPPRLV